MYRNTFRSRGNRSQFRAPSRPRQTAITSSNPAQYINRAEGLIPEIQSPIDHEFSDFQIPEQLKKNISSHGYSKPTPIQDQIIPLALSGKDVVGIANTGTGKTAAFLIPLIDKIVNDRSQKVLIMTPTRELALQINEELIAFAYSLNIYSVLAIGGTNMNQQINNLRRNPAFVIGTPGRLKDLANRNILQMQQYKTIVLDEVDRMLDIGFIKDIKWLLSLLPKQRHSLFFSATVSGEINNIISNFLNDPVTVSVKKTETAAHIDQDIIKVNSIEEKYRKLHELLMQDEFKKVIIFGRTKRSVERLAKKLKENGFKAASIHGNKSQNQRVMALSDFRYNKMQVLVATDIAARGLDIDGITHVINYDEPASYTDYIHRIGRTGRAEKSGKALTFIG